MPTVEEILTWPRVKAHGSEGEVYFRDDQCPIRFEDRASECALLYKLFLRCKRKGPARILFIPVMAKFDADRDESAEQLLDALEDEHFPMEETVERSVWVDLRDVSRRLRVELNTGELYGTASYAGPRVEALEILTERGPAQFGRGETRAIPQRPTEEVVDVLQRSTVPCGFEGVTTRARVDWAVTLEVREYGIKWLDIAVRRLQVPKKDAAHGFLRELGLTPAEDGYFDFAQFTGARSKTELTADGFFLDPTLHAIEITHQTRPLRDASVQLRARSGLIPSSSAELERIEYEYVRDPADAMDPAALLSAFQQTRDPMLAAHYAALLATANPPGTEEVLLRAAADPTEADEVLGNVLWALDHLRALNAGHTELLEHLSALPSKRVARQAKRALDKLHGELAR